MKFKYINSKGVVIDFSDYPYLFQDGNLMDYSWNYSILEGGFNKIIDVRRATGTRTFKLALIPDTSLSLAERQTKLIKCANDLYNAFEYDVINNKDGKIVTENGYFFPCRIMTSSKSDWLKGLPYMFQDFTAVSTINAWIKEEKKSFYKSSDLKIDSYLDYDFDYEYDYYGGATDTAFWDLEHLDNADFQLVIYGSAVNPSININGHQYIVYTSLNDDEFLTIDSRNGTVIKTLSNGTQTSVFDLRGKEESVFEPIPPQPLQVTWQGNFGFDLTVYVKRSEPEWT